MLEQPRRATPTIPPGFSAHVLPKTTTDPLSRPVSRNTFAVTPAVPVVPVTPKAATTPLKHPKTDRYGETSEAQASSTAPKSVTKPETPVKASRKANVATPQPKPEFSKAKVNQSSKVEEKIVEHHMSGSPAKTISKGKSPQRKGQEATSTLSTPKRDTKEPVTPALPPSSSKRQHPGKLDISAATKGPEPELPTTESSAKADGLSKAIRAVSLASNSSVPASPAATSTGSPIKRSTAPRTLRVLPTPKSEIPPPLSAVSVSSVPQVLPTVDKLRSRQASIASINLPGTPASEFVSDTASITSASLSRASSPPLIGGRIGSAPVRKKTKSQAKKERQERARQILEEQAIAVEEQTKSDPEPVQAPILGRKKKAKKPAAAPPKMTPVAAKSQPSSPKSATVEDAPEDEKVEPKVSPAPAAAQKSQETLPAMSSPRKSKAASQQEVEDAKDKLQPTAQAIIADLQKTGELLASTLEFFKPLSSSLAHAVRTAQSGNDTTPPDLKIHFSEADLDALAKKKPVRLNGQGGGKQDSRTLITPQGKFFWGLTQELEEKALELERHIEELKGSARFHPRKQTSHSSHSHHNHPQSKDVLPAIATALKEAGAKLSKGNVSPSSGQMPKLDSTSTLLGSTSLPLPPVQAPSDAEWLDSNRLPTVPGQQAQSPPQPPTPTDAGLYLNQFVLPKTDNPSQNSTRTEMAAVGGPPGAGMGNMAVNVNKIAKAAKAVAEGGTLGTELEGMGVMAADLLGGVVVQGLEALVGAGLGFHSTQDLGVDGQGNITLGGSGVDVQGLVDAIGSGSGMGGLAGHGVGHTGGRGRGRRSVLGVDEAELAMHAAKKDHDALEKKLAATIKRNRKMVGKV